MPSDWSITPQDQASIVITTGSPESLGPLGSIWGSSSFASTAWSSANFAIYIPFTVPISTTIVGGGPYNGSTATGNFDVGIYDDQQNRLVSSGSTAQAGATGWQIVSLTSTTLDPGVYYMALTFSSTSSTVFAIATTASIARSFGTLGQATALPLPARATFATNGTLAAIPLVAITTRVWI